MKTDDLWLVAEASLAAIGLSTCLFGAVDGDARKVLIGSLVFSLGLSAAVLNMGRRA